MKRKIFGGFLASLWAIAVHAQVFLSGTSYTESFDTLGSGLPGGWTVYTGANATSLGSAEAFSSSAVSWGSTAGAFNNYASANNPGVTSSDSVATQAAYTDRALGIRQIGTFGDPGAAFVIELADTSGFESFGLSLDLQMLSVQARSTEWTIDYRVGNSGSFTALGTFSDPGVFGSTTRTFGFGGALDNQPDSVFVRVAALSASTGSGSRDSFAIDNFSLTYTPVPEPREYALTAGLALLGFAAYRRWSLTRASIPR